MSEGTPARLSRKVRRLSPRTAVLTGGALMLAGQALFAVMLLAGGGPPALDASGLLVVPVILIGIALLWPRLAGVAVIAALAGALGPLAPSTSDAVLIGLVAALGFLAWVSPSANLPRPSTAADRPMRPPTGGR